MTGTLLGDGGVDSGTVKLIIWAVIIVFAVVSSLIQKLRSKKQEPTRGEAPPPEPQQEGAQLPYEELVDELFGPYMQRRREGHAAARRARESAPAEVEVVEEEEDAPEAPPPYVPRQAPAPAAPRPDFRIIEEEPSTRAALPPSDVPVATTTGPRVTRSLDEILFDNRALSPGAKLLLSAEILRRPGVRR